MASETLHENPETLGTDIIDQHRAIVSIMEELEAVDWYNQRAKATVDGELRAILEHNRDEEKEHAMMVLEWLRRHDPKLDTNMKKYLFNEKPPLEVEAAGAAGGGGADESGSLNIGDLRAKARPGAAKAGERVMNHLFRDKAPISDAGWEEIDKEATRTLKTTLGARRLVDFVGPKGWDFAAVSTGRSESIAPPETTKVEARLRKVLPLAELRVPFAIKRSELDAIDRGAKDPDTDPVIAAARQIAIAENHAVFHGYPDAGIEGICEGQASAAIPFTDDFTNFPIAIASAKTKLRDSGVSGPYAVALSERAYNALSETTSGGYPVLEHVRRLVDGPLVWTPGLEGAVVLSMRGGDFELTVGQDFSIGYLSHDSETVRLYIEESFTFWLLSEQAAIPLTRHAPAAKSAKT